VPKQQHAHDGGREGDEVEDLHGIAAEAALGRVDVVERGGDDAGGDQAPAGREEAQEGDGVDAPAEADAVEEAQDTLLSALAALCARWAWLAEGVIELPTPGPLRVQAA